MTEYPHLTKAPIKEALIDIRIKIKEDLNVEQIGSFYNFISDQYPNKQERRSLESRFEIKKGEPLSAIIGEDKVEGYAYVSTDETQVVQVRLDGFTFSRLKPYEKWELLRDEARRLWQRYAEITSPEIIRVALRYINRIEISEPRVDFKDYLTAPPIIPKGLPQGVSSFLTRLVIPELSMGVTCIVTQALEQIVDPNLIPIILDIDVFKYNPDGISEEEAWKLIEGLHHLKNKIFFESITEKLKEQLR